MSNRVLIVEDDRNLLTALSDSFVANGYVVDGAPDGEIAIRQAEQVEFDLIVLDVGLPLLDGIRVCEQIRGFGVCTPILMLSALTALDDKVRAFRAGADDYLTKPFDTRELLARAEALIRRGRALRLSALESAQFGDVTVDFQRGRVVRGGQRIGLSSMELQLLRYLIARKGSVVSRQELLSEVWGSQRAMTRTVDMHVVTLRQKLEDNPREPRYILTIRGEGYAFR